jgi:arylsulfatase A-like enzyme
MHCLLRYPPPFFGTVFGLRRFAAWLLAKVCNVNLSGGVGGWRFCHWFALAQTLGTCCFVAALMGAAPSAHGAAARPNILFIMADDLRYDALGFTGNPVLKTPNIDRLAERGTVFTKAFAPSPICSISRASVLTGQYPRRHGVNDFKTQIADMSQTYPMLLQRGGYYIGFIGKWGLDENNKEYFKRLASSFDFWGGSMGQSNYWHERDCHFVKNNGTTDRAEFFCDCPADAHGVAGEGTRMGRRNLKDPIHQETEVIPRKVEQFLEQRDRDKPFCLSISLKAPHAPWPDFPEEVRPLLRGVALPVKASVDAEHAASRPKFLQDSLSNRDRGARYAADTGPDSFLQAEMRRYYRLIAAMDIGMGKILDALEKHGVRDDTVIIFTSDHGHFFGEHGFDGKWLLYEDSIRIPLVIADPRQADEKRTSEALMTLVDMAPTMLDLGGVEVPATMQGESLLPLLGDPAATFREAFFMEHLYRHGPAPPTRIEPSEGVRTRDWKYINYVDQTGPLSEELYHLTDDPLEMKNVSQDPAHAAQLEALREKWQQLRVELQ